MSDDLLGKILGSPGRSDKPEGNHERPGGSAEPGEGESQTGLNPLDLLGLPPAQRDLVNWLSRRKQAQFSEIQEALALDAPQLTSVLNALKKARHIQEALIGGEVYFRVVFAGKVSRAARGLPESIWERVDLDNTVFLREIPLFRGLSDSELREISNQLEARQYRRNEVILWQGGLDESVYFIKSGIVGLTRLLPERSESQILAYLKQGDLLGEYRLLFEKNITASATATALSEVNVLVMHRDDVMLLLKRYPSAAIELVQMLAQRLLAADTRSREQTHTATLSLVFGAAAGVGATVIGNALAMKLAQVTEHTVAYTEHPVPHDLLAQFGAPASAELYSHPGGYDIFVPHGLSGVPVSVRATLVIERLMNNYQHIVMSITSPIDETVSYLLERATQIVVVTSPLPEVENQYTNLNKRLKIIIRPENTNLYTIYNRTQSDQAQLPVPEAADFDLPWFDTFPPLNRWERGSLPAPIDTAVTALANRLGRTNQIGIYIPLELSNRAGVNTFPYVERTIDMLGQLFGRATGYPTYNETDSDVAGKSGEKIYLVQTYVTKTDMDQHLGKVLAFVEQIKTELDQDAMALEVNHNIMLV